MKIKLYRFFQIVFLGISLVVILPPRQFVSGYTIRYISAIILFLLVFEIEKKIKRIKKENKNKDD